MTTKHIFATAAIAALAIPAAASADRPTDKPAKPSKPAKAAKPAKKKSVGFTVAGAELSGLTVTDGKLTGPVTLDPTSANKHARTFLGLSKEDVKGEKTASLGTADDAVKVKYVGLTATDAIQPTDRVKVIGKLSGTTLDIRKITVKRKSASEIAAAKTESSSTSTRKSPAEQCKGKSKKKAAGEKKSAYAKCVSAAAKAQNDDKPQS